MSFDDKVEFWILIKKSMVRKIQIYFLDMKKNGFLMGKFQICF